jgi:putative ABC transport system permease protein
VEVFPNISFSAEVRVGDTSEFTMISSLPYSMRTNDAFDTMTGQFFSSPDAQEAILRLQFAKSLAEKPETLVGKEISFRYGVREPLPASAAEGSAGSPAGEDGQAAGFTVVRKEKVVKIVGIVETQPWSGPSGIGLGRGGAYIPLALAEKMNLAAGMSLRDFMRNTMSSRTYQGLVVRVSSPSHVLATEQAIEKMGFNTFSLLEATRNLRRFFAVLDAFLGLFGSIALAVASLGIINTLVMSVLERRREIGIMKALGASNGDVKRLFFAEAGAMGFVGGALGVAMGWAIGKAINFGTNIYLQRQDLPPETIWSVPWWLVASAIAFSIFVSLLSGLYPAARAAKLDPVQALRYE